MKKSALFILVFILALLGAALPVLGQKQPDVSGTWVFDASRSSGLPQMVSSVKEFTKTIAVNETLQQLTLTNVFIMGPFHAKRGEDRGFLPVWLTTITFKLDGSESNVPAGAATPAAVVSAKWEKDTLVLTQRLDHEYAGRIDPILWVERWTLAEDGKSVTIHQTIKQGEARQEMTIVLNKQ